MLSGEIRYDLYAVSQHIGGLGGGHYTAVVKNMKDHKWYSFNDSVVAEADPRTAVTPQAYVLFYSRRKVSNILCLSSSES